MLTWVGQFFGPSPWCRFKLLLLEEAPPSSHRSPMGALTLLPIGSEQLCSWSHIGVSHPCPTGERKTLWLPRACRTACLEVRGQSLLYRCRQQGKMPRCPHMGTVKHFPPGHMSLCSSALLEEQQLWEAQSAGLRGRRLGFQFWFCHTPTGLEFLRWSQDRNKG